MPKLDFSQQATPASTLDFSGGAEPVEKVSPLAMLGRQFVAGGGDVINFANTIRKALDPAATVADAVTGAPNPVNLQAQEFATRAQQFGDLGPNEVADGLAGKVAGGVGRVVPNLAAALATGGSVSLESLVPQALAKVPALGRALLAIGRGAPTAAAMTTEQSANLPDNLTPLQQVEATGNNAAINLVLAGLPVAVGSGPLVRTATGGALGAAIPSGLAALSGQPQDVANNIVGGLTGALLAQGGGRMRGEPLDPFLDAYMRSAGDASPAPAAPLALPRGADFSAKAEPVRPLPVDLGGAVRVDPAGTAATPAQGSNAFAQAVASRMQPTAPGLPEPVVTVDRAGNAATSADQNAAMQPTAPTPADPLGLTERLRQLIAADPRTAREGAPVGPLALPAPTIAVDAQGTAATTSQLQQAIARQQQDAAERQALGITPDIERSQGVRWSKQQQAAAVEAERQARLAELDQVIATREAQNVPARGTNARPDETVDDALTFLAKKGGLDRRTFIKEGLDPAAAKAMDNRTRGGASRPLFRAQDKGGMSLDHAAEALWQHGYLPDQDNNAALDMILSGVNQDTKAYSIHRQDQGDLLAMQQARNDAVDHPADDFADVPFSRKPITNIKDPRYVKLRVLQGESGKLAMQIGRERNDEVRNQLQEQRNEIHRQIDALYQDPAYSFAGERAQTADRGALAQAKQMEAMGRDSVPDRFGNQPGSPEDTHIATGWHRGVDGKWRFEIDDSQAKLKDAIALKDVDVYTEKRDFAQQAMQRSLRDGAMDEADRLQKHLNDLREANRKDLTVTDVLDHPALFDAYPALADVKVSVKSNMAGLAAYSANANMIYIRPPSQYAPSGDGSLKSVLLHEIQHAIQDHEGFARGGSATEARKLPEFEATLRQYMAKNEGRLPSWTSVEPGPEQMEQQAAREVYRRLAGEVEARNTQRRLPMDAAQRRETPPSETADTPRSRQIVRFNADRADRSGPDAQDTQAIAKYNAVLSRYIGKPVRFTPAAHVPEPDARALAEADEVFGGRSILVDNATPEALDLNGVTLRDGTRLINSDATSPAVHVAMHEMGHQMKADAPDLFAELEAEMDRQGALDKYQRVLSERAARNGEDPTRISDELSREELVSDAIGDAMADPVFLEHLAQRNPGLFQRLGDYIMASLKALTRKLRDLGSREFLSDVEAFRTKLADVLERYAERQQAKREPRAASEETALSRKPAADQTETPDGELAPAFSRKPTDDADYLQDMPSRRPGESQAAYLRRITRKNGADIKAATALATQQRQLGRHALRGMMATLARQAAIADAAMRQARKTFDETPDVINFASVHQWETGEHIDDPDFRNFVATMQDGFDQRIEAIQKLAPGALESLIENYMPHLYEDSGKATKWYQNVMGKKPLQGDRSFLKQREWPTLKEAMASGLKPISPNPADWVLMKYHQMDKFIGLLTLKDDFARRGWLMKLEAGQRVPEGFARVEDPAFQIAGGMQGYYAVPEMIAKDINNYLAPGLSKYGAWRSMRAVQNAMVSWNLGWSAFHAGFTSIDNAVTHGAAGLQMLVDGDLIGGLTTLAKSVPTMLTSPFEGGRLNKQWTGQKATDVHTAALLDLLEQGGARMKMNNVTAEYNNALPQVLRTLRRMKASGYAADQLTALQRRLAAEPAAELARMGWGSLKGVGKAISAIGEVGSFLIHHVLVPNQKMAARVTLMKFELDHYAKQLGKQRGDYAGIISVMHPDVARQLASDVVDKVDFRLGQMTYENFFYPKIAREIAQMLVMAPGWQAGAYQTMTGGIRDVARLVKPEKLVAPLDKAGTITDAHRGRFTNNLANLIMLFLMVGGGNALWQYLVSGKEPDEMKDIVAPRTGRKNADDSDERIVLPSYMKDHYEFFNHPLQMASHKLHPAWRLMWEVGHNEDYFGNMIRDPHHPLGAQAKELAGYLLKSMLPFSATNVVKVRENGGGFGQHVANFVGVTPASASLARSKFQAFVAKGGERGWDGPAQTPTQAEYNNRMRKAENAMRTGQKPDLTGLNQQDVAKLQRRVRTFKPEMQFDRLSLADKLDAYELATPEERTRYHLTEVLIRTNPSRSIAFRRLPEEEQQALLKQLARIRQGKDQ